MFELLKRNNIKTINVNDIDKLLGNIKLIDIREKYEYREVSLKNSKNIPMSELIENHDKFLNNHDEYYIICQSGRRSSMVCNKLYKEGYNVVNVLGGVGSYRGSNVK